jgi:serine protease Do
MKHLFSPCFAALVAQFVIATAIEGSTVTRRTAIVTAVEKVKPSIVTLKVERNGNWGKKEVVGSGVIVDERGYVVTNQHVVGGALKVTVILPDNTEVAGKIHLEDSHHDLAIVRLPGNKNYRPMTFGPGSDLMVGETVIAIGHPYGYVNTVSTGIVSALGRSIEMPSGETLTNLIQTNASINPGNSGGPLVNIDGEVIGINVAMRDGAQGIAFALNADTVQQVLAKHLSASKMSRVQHGLCCSEKVLPDGDMHQQVVVDAVAENTPAADAGLRKGDVILKLGDRVLTNRFDVERAFWSYKAGEKVEACVLRAGMETSIALVIAQGGQTIVSAKEDGGTNKAATNGSIQTVDGPR